jgi:hypothetical protein
LEKRYEKRSQFKVLVDYANGKVVTKWVDSLPAGEQPETGGR